MKNLTYRPWANVTSSLRGTPNHECASPPLADTFMSQMWVKGENTVTGSSDLIALMDKSIYNVLDSNVAAYDNIWRPGEKPLASIFNGP